MRFIHPQLLVLIVPAAAVLYLLARRKSAHRPWLHFGVRLLAVAAAGAAAAGVEIRRPDFSFERIFVLDVSDSAGLDAAATLEQIRTLADGMDSRDRIGVIAFGERASVEFEPASPRAFRMKKLKSPVSRSASDIEAALALARSLRKAGTPGQVVLLSDGNENRGTVRHEALRLAADGLPVYCLPVQRHAPDFSVRLREWPMSVRPGEPFAVTAEVAGAGPVQISLRTDEGGRVEDTLVLAAGSPGRLWRAELSLQKPGLHIIEAAVNGTGDSFPQNNTAAAAVWVAGPASLLWITPAESTLAKAAEGRGCSVTMITPSQVPANASALQAYDAVVIEDAPRWAIPKQSLDALKHYVQHLGGGLVMLGGADAFGPGGYAGSPIEEALPVKCSPEEQETKPLALVMIVDRSGSMNEKVRGRTKLNFAQEGVALVLDQLKAEDQIAVIAFSGTADVAVPLGSVEQKDDLRRKIASLEASGTTDVGAALEAAIAQLDAAGTDSLRHAVLLSDGLSKTPVDVSAWAGRFSEKKITLSVAATGDQVDKPLLKGLADGTGGRFYSVDNIESIPEIFLSEARPAERKLLKHSPQGFRLRLLESPFTSGLPAPSSASSYVLVKMKDAAMPAIDVDGGKMLLTSWRFGAGRSAAFAAPAGVLAGWPGAGPMWAAVLAWAASPEGAASVTTTLKVADGKLGIEIADADVPGLIKDYHAAVVLPSGKAATVRLRQEAPGLYSGETEAEEPGVYPISIVENTPGSQLLRARTAAVVRYSQEWLQTRANDALLAEISSITGGKVIDDLSKLPSAADAQAPAKDGKPAPQPFSNISWLAAVLALALFLGALTIP